MKKIFLMIWFLTLFLFACDGDGGGDSQTPASSIKVF